MDSFRWGSSSSFPYAFSSGDSSSFPYAFSSDLKFVHDGNTFLITLLTCKKEVSLKSIQKIRLVNVYRIFVSLNQKIYPWWKSLIGQLAKSHDFQMKLLLNVMTYSMSWKKSHDFIWSFSCTILSDDFTHSSTKMFWFFACLEQDGLTGWQRSNRRVFPDLFGRIKLYFYPSFHGFSEISYILWRYLCQSSLAWVAWCLTCNHVRHSSGLSWGFFWGHCKDWTCECAARATRITRFPSKSVLHLRTMVGRNKNHLERVFQLTCICFSMMLK